MKRKQLKNYLTKNPPNSKRVCRPSRWGNPYTLKDYTLKESLQLYRLWLQQQIAQKPDFLQPLQGFDLLCYCPLDQPCHADIILEYLKEVPR